MALGYEMLRIALAGGGGAQESACLDRQFAAWIKPAGRLLYLPIALGWPEAEYSKAYTWLASVFQPLGVERIDMWTRLEGRQPSALQRYAAVYLGGGNTFYLLHELRRSGLTNGLIRFARSGRPIYGGSAGAVVLGRDIVTAGHLDHNAVGLVDTAGLNLALGSAVWVHHTAADNGCIERYAAEPGQRLFVLSERAGIAIEGGSARSVGFDPSWVVEDRHWYPLPS